MRLSHAVPSSQAVVAAVALSLGAFGCSSGSNSGSTSTQSSAVEDVDAGPADFDCLQNSEWTAVGLSQYKNVLGHTDEMLAVARSLDGGTFPVGTIVQLIPNEASVKRHAGFNAASNDWEFFSLNPTAAGTTIVARGGGASVINFAGESCLNCHDKAAPQWDLICGDQDGGNTHGCAALPVTSQDITFLRSQDARCNGDP
jgi:hypothetical protein